MSNPSLSSPWFGVSMALVGVIVGYGGAQLSGFVPAAAPRAPTQIADNPGEPEAPPAAQNVKPVDKKKDHIRGDVDAPITIIEYSDFECPFCARHHPTMQQAVDEYDGKVNWVYRHFPLSFHPNAQKSAEASECAFDQGGNDAFWEYADILFEKGAVIASLTTYAEEIGLDKTEFQTCLDSGKFAQKVTDDMNEGSAAGVSGTPGNIVLKNGTDEASLVSGAQPFSAFKSVIDGML